MPGTDDRGVACQPSRDRHNVHTIFRQQFIDPFKLPGIRSLFMFYAGL